MSGTKHFPAIKKGLRPWKRLSREERTIRLKRVERSSKFVAITGLLKKRDVPPRTYYRYLRNKRLRLRPLRIEDINDALRVLMSPEPASMISRERAFFRLITWMARGNDPKRQWIDRKLLHIAYLCRSNGVEHFRDLQPRVQRRVGQVLLTDHSKMDFVLSDAWIPWLIPADEYDGHTHMVMAELAARLLGMERNHRNAVCLTSALQRQVSAEASHPLPKSVTTLHALWTAMAPTAAFHFVFFIVPPFLKRARGVESSTVDFEREIRSLLRSPKLLVSILALCASVQELLIDRLDARVHKRLAQSLPTFPPDLSERVPPELWAELKAFVARFGPAGVIPKPVARTDFSVPDEVWAALEERLPIEPSRPRRGRPRLSDRAALTGILWWLHSGQPWEQLGPELHCGSGKTCERRLKDWQDAGLWAWMASVLQDRLPFASEINWDRAAWRISAA